MSITSRSLCALCIALCWTACSDADPPPEPSDRAPSEDYESAIPNDEVVEIALDVDPRDWDVIRAQGRTLNTVYSGCATPDFDYTTVEGRLRIGKRDFGRVGVRKKGYLGSLSVNKPSLRIELDAFKADQRWRGSKTLVLNNSKQDPSFTHQCMAYARFRAAGVPASECGFARVAINGGPARSYVLVEPIKKPFLARRFGDDSGELYEGSGADFREDRFVGFEKKNNGPAAPSGILERIAEVLADPGADLRERLEPLIDLPAFLRFWATETLVAHWDGYTGDTNNFFVYVHPDSGKLAFIPWGTDGAFDYDHRLLPEVGRPQSVYAVARLALRLYQLPETRELYRATLRALLDDHWDEESLLEEVDQIAMRVPEAMPEALEAQRAFIRDRRAQLEAELDAEAPVWPFDERGPFPCNPQANTELTATFEIPWGTLNEIEGSTMNTLELTVDGEHHRYAPTLASAGLARPDQGGDPSFQLLAPLPERRTLVLQLYLGERPLHTGEVHLHGIETYGVVVNSRDPEHYDLKGFVGDGVITFDELGTEPGAMLRGRIDARLVALVPALAGILSE